MLSKFDNIGGDGNLAVVLIATSYPNVRCERQNPPPMLSCTSIADTIRVTQNAQSFGYHQSVNVPWIQSSRMSLNSVLLRVPTQSSPRADNRPVDDDLCELLIDVTGPLRTTVDIFSWYRVWEEVTAIMYMCVAVGKRGSSVGNGKLIECIQINM